MSESPLEAMRPATTRPELLQLSLQVVHPSESFPPWIGRKPADLSRMVRPLTGRPDSRTLPAAEASYGRRSAFGRSDREPAIGSDPIMYNLTVCNASWGNSFPPDSDESDYFFVATDAASRQRPVRTSSRTPREPPASHRCGQPYLGDSPPPAADCSFAAAAAAARLRCFSSSAALPA
jgi:hypothetical protein